MGEKADKESVAGRLFHHPARCLFCEVSSTTLSEMFLKKL